MTQVLMDENKLTMIADLVRKKNKSNKKMSVTEIAENTNNIIPGERTLENLIITKNVIEFDYEGVDKIGNYVFYNCKSLTSVNFPNVTTIGAFAFSNCNSLTSVNFPNVTTIGSSAFSNCKSLTSVNFPNVTIIGHDAFYSCNSLTSIDFPNVTTIGNNAFFDCKSLTSVIFPKVVAVGQSAFRNCRNLKTIEFLDNVQFKNSNLFTNCYSLKSLILRNGQILSLTQTNLLDSCYHFTGTVNETYNPEGLKDGYIYVPTNLVEEYKVATNWSVYASQIKAIEGGLTKFIPPKYTLWNSTETISIYGYPSMENPITTNPTVTVTSSDENVISITNLSVVDSAISFDVNSHAVDGSATITVTYTIGDETFTQTATYTVIESMPESTWSVEPIEGVANGFTLNNSGYYESTNAGVNNSYSICKVNFWSNGIDTMKLNCINSGESNYDFGILSKVDTTLQLNTSADTANVFKSFKGLSSTSVQTVDYGVIPEGNHFIYVKYRKDVSTHSGNDSLQFTVEFV
jgi:hypothetical protein